MTTCQLSPVIEHIRLSAVIRDGAGLTDAQLLSRFIERGDAAAFEALVRRHGPMVLGVGRRLLRNHHDAEDAFQATFLVLVRRAESIVPPEKLANWL
jgi:DNA-directed RNA polymerase specialized sigma24 family protein